MTPIPPVQPSTRQLISAIKFANFEVSWAGAAPRSGDFCFGSEDGRILLTDVDGVGLTWPNQGSPSSEAINGMAFFEPWVTLTTRTEIVVRHMDTSKGSVVPIGAHGVIAGPNGYFFAPLGPDGILLFRPNDSALLSETLSPSLAENLNCYRLIHLRSAGGREIIASAARKGGIAALEFKGENQQNYVSVHSVNDLDVVDLCPLNVAEEAPVVALGRDGTIIFFRDILQGEKPRAIKYQAIKGTAYRVLNTCGQLLVLTSEGLYVFRDLVDQVMRGVANPITQTLKVPMEAVDANLAGERWLLVVMPDGVLRLDAELLLQHSPNGTPSAEIRELSPTPVYQNWNRREVVLAVA